MISKKSMESDIQRLDLATGIKDSRINAGFTTVSFILNNTTIDISKKLGIDLYVAQIIFDEAKKKKREVVIADTATTVNKDNDSNNNNNNNNNNYLLSIQ
jgi:hypothetical protein